MAIVILNDALPNPNLDPRWALVFKIEELWGLECHNLSFGLATKAKRLQGKARESHHILSGV